MDRRTISVLIVFIFVSIFLSCNALVCDPKSCAKITNCKTVAECHGRVEKTGYCGCCSRCITQQAEGESCFSSILLGVPATAECGNGLTCDPHKFVCVKQSSPLAGPLPSKRVIAPCTARLQTIQQSQSSGMPLLGVPTPVCDAQGYYAPVQCAGSQCYCATKDGSQIQTYSANAWEKSGMDCQCALDQHAYMQTGLIGKLFFCAPNGNYPPTPTATTVATVATGPCATQAAAMNARLTAAQNAGTPLLGLTVPKCDVDGYYQPKQCSGSQCYCVTKSGQAISGYRANRWEASHMTCQCARDKDDYQKTGLIGRMFNCMNNGNYQQYQCTGSVCYCVDDSGKQMGSQAVNIGSVNSLKCS